MFGLLYFVFEQRPFRADIQVHILDNKEYDQTRICLLSDDVYKWSTVHHPGSQVV